MEKGCGNVNSVFLFWGVVFTEVLTFNVLNFLRQCLISNVAESGVWPQQLQIIPNIIRRGKNRANVIYVFQDILKYRVGKSASVLFLVL